MEMTPELIHLIYIGIVTFLAAVIIIAAHICVLFQAPHNIELGKTGKIVWPILAVVFLFAPVFLISPIPFYFFFANYDRKWRLFGALTLGSFIVLDCILAWAHFATEYNLDRSVALERFFPPASEGWTTADVPGNQHPFISIGLTEQATATRTYTDVNEHKITLVIAPSPIAGEIKKKFYTYADLRITPDAAKEQGATLKESNFTFIKDCLVVYDRAGQILKEPALVMLAGDYAIMVGSATEPEETLEQLLRTVNVYELRSSQP